jgi:tetratricopeptide (TPR) repeat protein
MKWKGRAHNYLVETSRAPAVKPLLPRDRLLVSHHTDLTKPRGYQIAGVALEALFQPGSPRWAYFLGRELASRRHFRSALPILTALDRPGVTPAVRSAGLCFAAHCLAATGGLTDEVQELLFRAVRRDSTRRDPWVQLARLSLALGDMQGAASFAAAALAIPAQVGMSEVEENLRAGPHAISYWALFWLGRRDEARVHFETCQGLDPDNSVYLEHAKLFKPVAHRRPVS